MSSWAAQMRRAEAEQRRQDRESRKRQKELEKRIKEKAKLSELEQAQLEVEAHENALEVLLSVHKEQSAPIEWSKFAAALPPHPPVRAGRREFAAMLKHGVAEIGNTEGDGNSEVERAYLSDEREYQSALERYNAELAECEKMRALAKGVLSGAAGAYSEALSEFSSLSEIAHLGSSIHVTVHNPKLIECVLTVNGREVIPAEVKSLTAAGKLTVKAMPKSRFHEIYQDYVCGCVLRLARELLASLPIKEVLVTASVNGIDARIGKPAELPVLSVGITREIIEGLDFERLDPSDSMENFLHRGDVQASRKSGEFVAITPLKPADLVTTKTERMNLSDLLVNTRQLRAEIGYELRPAEESSVKHTAQFTAP